MRRVDCTVLHAGNQNMRLRIEGISVAEVQLLRFLHGADSVIDFWPRGNDRRPHKDEKEHLRAKYKKHIGEGSARRDLVDHLWPSHDPRLPVELSDIGIELDDRQKAAVSDADAETARNDEAERQRLSDMGKKGGAARAAKFAAEREGAQA